MDCLIIKKKTLSDQVGINGEIGGLGPGQITAQARQLLLVCLEHGGDPNLPTTDAAKSIYHLAVTAVKPDTLLLDRLERSFRQKKLICHNP